jgi:hypothetical protein
MAGPAASRQALLVGSLFVLLAIDHQMAKLSQTMTPHQASSILVFWNTRRDVMVASAQSDK